MATKPVILTVDDDREVLAAIERDLKRHYRDNYRVIGAKSGAEAMEVAREIQKRGGVMALFLVDQRMPQMTGVQFLQEARALHPDAMRVLLTAYADTDAAIDAINQVGLHHYLMKPWDPPELKLYPVLDDLLSEWAGRVRLPFDGIRVHGARWCPDSYAARDFLSRNQVRYQWVDIDQDEKARALAVGLTGDPPKLPVILFPDGTTQVAPGITELAAKAGLNPSALLPFYDVVIIGGGPAGLANAVYAASEGLRALLIERQAPGGQAGSSSYIENYLGFPDGVTGVDLAQRAVAQAKRFGVEMMIGHSVAGVRCEDPYRIVTMANGQEVSCYALVIATGMTVRELEVPGVKPLVGAGVYYGAAMSEAALYRGQDVAVVGGANSAGQGALFFSLYARNVTILVRHPALSPWMSRYLVERIEETPNIQVIPRVEVAEACGSRGRLEQVAIRNLDSGEGRALNFAAMFVYIGTAPHTESFTGFVEVDEKGFILTGPDVPRSRSWPLERDPLMFETSVPGVFAAGDVRHGANRRIAAAVGEGSAAIYSVHKYLQTV